MSRIKAGLCLHLRSTSSQSKHLWIVLTDPGGDPSEVAIVNLTTHKKGLDETVVLDAGDHSYVKHKTIVNYAGAKIVQSERLEMAIEADLTLVYKDECSPELLEKIRSGVATSPFATPAFQKYCKAMLGKQRSEGATAQASPATPKPS